MRDGTGAPVATMRRVASRAYDAVETGGGRFARCWADEVDAGEVIDQGWHLEVEGPSPAVLHRFAVAAIPLACRLRDRNRTRLARVYTSRAGPLVTPGVLDVLADWSD